MPDVDRMLACALVSLVTIVVPGPSVLFVISRGVSLGRRAALTTVLGDASGFSLQVVGVAFGLAAVVHRCVAVFGVLKLTGACYLVYLGIQTLRQRRQLTIGDGINGSVKSTRRVFRDGLVV